MTILSGVTFCKVVYDRERIEQSVAVLALICTTDFVERIMKNLKNESFKFLGVGSNKNMPPSHF